MNLRIRVESDGIQRFVGVDERVHQAGEIATLGDLLKQVGQQLIEMSDRGTFKTPVWSREFSLKVESRELMKRRTPKLPKTRRRKEWSADDNLRARRAAPSTQARPASATGTTAKAV